MNTSNCSDIYVFGYCRLDIIMLELFLILFFIEVCYGCLVDIIFFLSLSYIENNIFFSWNKCFNVSLLPNAILIFNLFFKNQVPCLLFILCYSWIYAFITGGNVLNIIGVSVLAFYILSLVLSKTTSRITIFIFVITIYNLWFVISYFFIKILSSSSVNFSLINKRILTSYLVSSFVSALILVLYNVIKRDKPEACNLDNIKNV